jgi:hypothetical protein
VENNESSLQSSIVINICQDIVPISRLVVVNGEFNLDIMISNIMMIKNEEKIYKLLMTDKEIERRTQKSGKIYRTPIRGRA